MIMEAKGTLKRQNNSSKEHLQSKYFVLIEGETNKKGELKQNRIGFDLKPGLENKNVDVEFTKNRNQITIQAIVCEGERYSKNVQKENKTGRRKQQKKPSDYSYTKRPNNKIYSKTPYNFVPLNEKVLVRSIFTKVKKKDGTETIKLKSDCANNIYHKDRFTGSLKISIKNETPLFIGAHKRASERHRGFNEIEPYKINGKPAIPGSSIRGMLYNLIEIFGWGPMVNLVDKPVYFRSTIKDFQKQKQLKFGILTFYNSTPKIYDFSEFVEKLDYRNYRNQLKLIDDDNYIGLSSGEIMGKVHSFGVKKRNLNFNDRNIYGSSSLGKVLEDYKSDANRADQIDSKVDIIHKAKNHKIKGTQRYGCPVWFSVEGEEVISIGHAKYHRIPATHRSIDKLPGDHRIAYDNRQTIDEKNPPELSLAERIFGISEFRATKIRIEDALSNDAVFEELRLLKSLQSPKIKSANLYLKSEGSKPSWQDEEAEQELRGFKMYYNKSDNYKWYDSIARRNDFKDDRSFRKKLNQQKKIQSVIAPIKSNSTFKTTIHFNDLSSIELGAILFSFQLPKHLRHSLGMGKPFGLGRVKIKIEELSCIDVRTRYERETLIKNNSRSYDDTEIKDLISKFEKFILKQIDANDKESLWDLDRLRNAYGLMQLRNESGEDRKSEYMDLKSFKPNHPIINDPINLESYYLTGKKKDFLKK